MRGGDGFVWNEKDGKWEPVISNDNLKEGTFFAALEENKLVGQLSLLNRVRYSLNDADVYPGSIYLQDDLLSALADVMYCADGIAVEVDNIADIANEYVAFEHVDTNGYDAVIIVYNNGYIRLNDVYYDVGIDYTDKILYNVKIDGEPIGDYYWNQKERRWYTGSSGNKEKETSPAESVDIGYDSDYFEEDINDEIEIEIG